MAFDKPLDLTTFEALRVVEVASESEKRQTEFGFVSMKASELQQALTLDERTEGPLVCVRLKNSSINYKDALAVQGHPGIAKRLPLIPGIDAAGVVEQSESDSFAVGDEVMIFHALFGTEHHGGYAELAVVPADWVYPVPKGLSMEDVMTIGTGGFTAAQCVEELIRHDILPDSGPIVVTGATGGVGVFAVILLAKLGYEVVASTGKLDQSDWLIELGADRVIGREALDDTGDRPLLKSTWAGAVDSVGGNTLATIIRQTKLYGCVTACGLVGGIQLPLSVYPFILRGVTLQGIDTANIARGRRASIWKRLANEWKIDGVESLRSNIPMREIPGRVELMLAGKHVGRIVVDI